jgi:4-amino-4-deoxy-L-arabinose transferase-like glycosyltransferase
LKSALVPTPALVTHRAAQRLPRAILLLFCAAYVLPGVLGRDPWKNADLIAVGHMMELARGHSDWLNPTLLGWPADGGLLPYWLGAASIALFGPWLDVALAARIPFALVLAATLACVWYGSYHLARGDAAQPLAFAFGGEADRVDYARAIADAALLGLIASLGLLQLGHETTPELLQLGATSLYLYALAASQSHQNRARAGVLLALPVLACSAAPVTAVWFGVVGAWITWRSKMLPTRRLLPWILAATALAAILATALDAWVWRISDDVFSLATPKLVAWFTWPLWPLAAWTLWQWRRQLGEHHLAVPIGLSAVAAVSSIAMGGSDRALMLAMPSMAVFSAFALPTLKRSVSAAIDWFSVFFFSAAALTIWLFYIAVQTGTPAKLQANALRLLPGFQPSFNALALVLALLGSLAWAWLVWWRTGRHRPALWKSLVLPAGGVALGWLLLMTLWLPLLDHARSYRPMMQHLARLLPAETCVQATNLSRPQLAALLLHTRWSVHRGTDREGCNWLLVDRPLRQPVPTQIDGRDLTSEWQLVERVRRPGDKNESLLIFRRR